MNDNSNTMEPQNTKSSILIILDAKIIMNLLIEVLIFIVVALAPTIPYLKQYMIIKSRRDVGAFSIYVCAIVLYGQGFRILFWYSLSLIV